MSAKGRNWVFGSYWFISALNVVLFLGLIFFNRNFAQGLTRNYVFSILIGLFIAKLFTCLFLFVDDSRRIAQWLFTKAISVKAGTGNQGNSDAISRSVFLSWLGMAAGSSLFGTLLYGFGNKYNYQLVTKKLRFNNLPESFRGLRIAHISDIHSGSFTDKKAVEKGISKLMEQRPDIILFTGDLVNNKADEMDDYKELFSMLKAPMGVYSILGNHDYGDYIDWSYESITKQQNLDNLKKVHADMGWRLLVNEHVMLQKDNHNIALLGIENWSSKIRFPKYGRLDLAYAGTEKAPFRILMSHDPSHWDAQVLKDYKDIDLTLSGHTHGMQFGLEMAGFKWSPVQYVYSRWSGLYEEGAQKLYVNPGFGFLGYPGRVGVMPEITMLELV
jgi:predicted MPP superfamily phosphohydrolase